MRRTMVAATAVLGLAVVAGCADEEAGTPSNGGGGAASEPQGQQPEQDGDGSGLPHSAPVVPEPIEDTTQWESDPCSAISDEQFSSIGIEIRLSEPHSSVDGEVCEWMLEDRGAFSGGLATEGTEGLSNIYEMNDAGQLAHFEELPAIEGHPAVSASVDDAPSDGTCAAHVGLRDDLNYTVAMTGHEGTPQGKEPCEWAAKIAGLAVQTMKGEA